MNLNEALSDRRCDRVGGRPNRPNQPVQRLWRTDMAQAPRVGLMASRLIAFVRDEIGNGPGSSRVLFVIFLFFLFLFYFFPFFFPFCLLGQQITTDYRRTCGQWLSPKQSLGSFSCHICFLVASSSVCQLVRRWIGLSVTSFFS